MQHKDNIIWNKGERVFLTGETMAFAHGVKPLYKAIVLTGYRAGQADYISEERLRADSLI